MLSDYRALKDILGEILQSYENKEAASGVSLKVAEEEKKQHKPRQKREKRENKGFDANKIRNSAFRIKQK